MSESLETPGVARDRVKHCGSELVAAELSLMRARDREVELKHKFESAKRRVLLAADAPRVSRDGFTVAQRDAWVESRVEDEEFAFRVAEAVRQAAKDHYETVNTQCMLAQALLKSIDRAFGMGTRDDA